MASDNLVLRGGTWHARMVIPSDVRHILNRREFTSSLKTGNKTEAQRKKIPALLTWQNQIDEARFKVSGNGDDWKDKVWRASQHIADNYRGVVTGLALSEPEFLAKVSAKGISSLYDQTIDYIAHCQKRGIFNRAQMATMEDCLNNWHWKWLSVYDMQARETPLALEQKIQCFTEFTEAKRVISYHLITRKNDMSKNAHEETIALLKDPTLYRPKTPITNSRIEAFEKHQKVTRGVIPKSVDMQVSRLKRFREYLEEQRFEFDFDAVAKYMDSLKETHPLTKKQHLFAGNAFWKWANKYDLHFKEAYRNTTSPFLNHDFLINKKGKRDEGRKAFSPEDIKKLYTNALEHKNTHLKDLICIATYTGCRIEEICQLHIEKSIIKEGNIQCFSIEDAKSPAGIRKIPIHTALLPTVERLKKQSPNGMLVPSKSKNKYGILSDLFSKAFGRFKLELGYDKSYVFHSIRKTVITQLQRAGVDGITIASIVGHETGTITFDIYSEGPSTKQKQKALEKLKFSLT